MIKTETLPYTPTYTSNKRTLVLLPPDSKTTHINVN